MFGFQTLACLHDIPVVRSSTNIIQNVYAKAKDTSVLIRIPCNVAESVADKSLKIALTIATPVVKPFSGPVRSLDDYTAQKIRQIESKYPAITTPTEDVVNSFNDKTEPVRNVMNSVKDTTTSTIQHGKETVSNVATATVNKASGVADSVFTFCESRVPGIQRGASYCRAEAAGCAASSVSYFLNYLLQSVQSFLVWFRMLAVFFLLKTKQINDVILSKSQRLPLINDLPQRLLIAHGTFLEYVVTRVQPDDRSMAELNKNKQQTRLPQQQPRYFVNRANLKPDPSVTTRQSVVTTKQETVIRPVQPDYSNMTDSEELLARLAGNAIRPSSCTVDEDYLDEVEGNSADIALLHSRLQPSDVELLYSRLPGDIVVGTAENDQPLTADQQSLHARVIGAELERQGYVDGSDEE